MPAVQSCSCIMFMYIIYMIENFQKQNVSKVLKFLLLDQHLLVRAAHLYTCAKADPEPAHRARAPPFEKKMGVCFCKF